MKYKLLILILFISSFVKAQVTADAGLDRLICINDSLKVTGTGLNPNDTGSYQWKNLTGNLVVSNTGLLQAKITSLTSRQYELTVTKNSYKGVYTDKDTFEMTVSPLPAFTFTGLPPRCYDDGAFNLTLNIVAFASQGNDPSKKFYDLRYYQQKNPGWITGGPVGSANFIYNFPKFISNGQIPTGGGLRDTICYEYKDANGCYNYECKPIRINPNPDVKVNDGVFCQKAGMVDLDKLAVIPFNKVGGIQNWRCIKVPIGSGINKDSVVKFVSSPNAWLMDPGLETESQKTGDYLLEYCFKDPTTTCQRCDTSKITVIRLPKIKFEEIPGRCVNGPLLTLDSFVKDNNTGKHLTGGAWQCVEFGLSRDMNNTDVKNAINNSVTSQKYFNPKTGAGQYLLKFSDVSSGCPVSDSDYIIVNGLPQLKLPGLDSVCSGSGKYQLKSNYAFGDTNMRWAGEGVETNLFNSDKITLGSSYSKRIKIWGTYTNPFTKCTNMDSTYFDVIKRPGFKFGKWVLRDTQFFFYLNFYLSDSNMDVSKFKWFWDFDNGATGFDKYPKEILYMDSGRYEVFLTIDNGVCATSDSLTFTLDYKSSSVAEIKKLINVYPNPVYTDLFINAPIEGHVSLFDISGKLQMEDNIQSDETKRIDMEMLQPGIYLLSIRNNEVSYWTRVIKH